ncbi:MAG: carboxypeptidase regulatory-like domain-containing protein [Planctomycetia bacterium]|nr:carboxypeptidase regulatory-like domain-containing protein [Planctomycetia bacterium]
MGRRVGWGVAAAAMALVVALVIVRMRGTRPGEAPADGTRRGEAAEGGGTAAPETAAGAGGTEAGRGATGDGNGDSGTSPGGGATGGVPAGGTGPGGTGTRETGTSAGAATAADKTDATKAGNGTDVPAGTGDAAATPPAGPSGGLFGTVTGRDGLPVAGASVRPRGAPEAATTDAAGHYELAAAPAGKVRVDCTVTGEGTMTRWTTVEEGKKAELNFALDGIVLHGFVRRAGRPLAATRLEFDPEQGSEMDGSSATTGAAGAYRTVLAKPGLLMVRVEADTVRFAVPAGVADFERDIELLAGTIAGRVYDDATRAAVAGARIEAFRDLDPRLDIGQAASRFVRASESGPDGAFELRDLPEGTYTLHVSGTGGFATVTPVVLEKDGFASGADAYLTAGARVEGTVLDVGGKPVAGASFTMREVATGAPMPLPGLDVVRSDAAGKFRVEGVPQGNVRITAHAAGLAKVSATVPVTLAGATIEFRLAPEGRVRVHVLDAAGNPVPKAGLVVRDAAGVPVDPSPEEFADPAGSQSDAQGYVTRRGLPRGHFSGEAAASAGRAPVAFDVEEGKTTELEAVVKEVR